MPSLRAIKSQSAVLGESASKSMSPAVQSLSVAMQVCMHGSDEDSSLSPQ